MPTSLHKSFKLLIQDYYLKECYYLVTMILPSSNGVYIHLYVPSLLLLTKTSILLPDGEVTNDFTLPSPDVVTERASTVNSVVDSRNTPKQM